MESTVMLIIGFISTALSSSAITTLINQWFSRRKVKAEAEVTTVDGTVKWAESMRKDLDDLRTEFKELQRDHVALLKENFDLKQRIFTLENLLKVHNVSIPIT
jgi:predicted  nucleic acid-binding Zn-ribbon protein